MMQKQNYFSEMQGTNGARTPYAEYDSWFAGQNNARLSKKSQDAEAFFRRTGITFNVYGQTDAEERLIPFDLVPRIISSREWSKLSKGIEQRVYAINAFLHDIYNRQEILRAGVVPVDLIAKNEAFLPQMIDFSPPGDVYTHIVGTDIVRTGEDDFFVLEDNARTPSGVSYMLENRETMLQMFPLANVRVDLGQKKISIGLQNGRLAVRVGGGFIGLNTFLKRYGKGLGADSSWLNTFIPEGNYFQNCKKG